ncbi:hypothetical protein ACWEOV_43780 [Streptomyces sp. NPDC004365]
MTDWADAIRRMLAAQRQLRENDREHLWRYEQLPPPASRELLGLVQAQRGVTLDSQYAELLVRTGGWPAFMQDVDLFGTPDLLGEPFDEAVAVHAGARNGRCQCSRRGFVRSHGGIANRH